VSSLRFTEDWDESDLSAVHAVLVRSYWCEGIPRETLARAMRGSLNFLLHDAESGELVAYARVVSDRATFAYLCDVFVIESRRGEGLGRRLMERVAAHPDLQGLRRFSLVTRDAHGLYAKFGFTPLVAPERGMEIVRPGLYLHSTSDGAGP